VHHAMALLFAPESRLGRLESDSGDLKRGHFGGNNGARAGDRSYANGVGLGGYCTEGEDAGGVVLHDPDPAEPSNLKLRDRLLHALGDLVGVSFKDCDFARHLIDTRMLRGREKTPQVRARLRCDIRFEP
jgi:hypothetical protein